MNWKQTTQEEFFDTIGPLDVISDFITDTFPYSKLWKLRYGKVIGKTVDEFSGPNNQRPIVTKYYLTID